MNNLLKALTSYAKRADMKDLSVIRFCLIIAGLFAGLLMPQKLRRPVCFIAGIACIVTCIPHIIKLFDVLSIGNKNA